MSDMIQSRDSEHMNDIIQFDGKGGNHSQHTTQSKIIGGMEWLTISQFKETRHSKIKYYISITDDEADELATKIEKENIGKVKLCFYDIVSERMILKIASKEDKSLILLPFSCYIMKHIPLFELWQQPKKHNKQ